MDFVGNQRGNYEIVNVKDSPQSSNNPNRSGRARRTAAISISILLGIVLLVSFKWTSNFEYKGRNDDLLEGSKGSSESLFAVSSLQSPVRKSFLFQYESEIPQEVSSAMNFSVDPCINFYEHVCGKWIETAEIPPDKGSLSKSWDGAEDRVKSRLRGIFEAEYPPGLHPPGYPDAPYTRLHDWYESCMDLETVERLGASPIKPILEKVDSIATRQDLEDMLAYLMYWNIPTFFALNVAIGVRAPAAQLAHTADRG